jgi:type IV pilus assembly protein PilQ
MGLFLLGSWYGAFSVEAAPVRMQVVEGDVRAVLLSAARLGGLELVLDDTVTGQVTVSLYDEPEHIMQMVTATQGLVMIRDGQTYIITTQAKSEALSRVHVYTVKYANPTDLAKAINLSLQGAGKSFSMSNKNNDTKKSNRLEKIDNGRAGDTGYPEGRTIVNESAGSVLFYGTEAEAQDVELLARQLDVPTPQVSLEAKVVEISKQASKDLGVEWQWSKLPQYPQQRKTYRNEGESNERVEQEVRRQWQGNEQVPGIIQFGHGPEGQPFEFYFSAQLNALVNSGKAKILARPNITTIQGHEAVINIGGEVPVPTQSVTNSTTTTSLTYRQAGIILRYTPRVNADGHITAEVHTEVSSPLFVEDIKAYRFQKRSADTTVRLRDGETMVIGGLIGSEESKTFSKVPFLGDLPVLGVFFRNLKRSHSESEIMIFLTAHILDDVGSTECK